MAATMEERLTRLEGLIESKAAVPPPALKRGLARLLAWMGAELPKLLAAAVLLVLGFALKDSVDLAIKQRQLDLSYSKEMQGLLLQLNAGGSLPQLQSAAVVLASYGEAALPALLSELRHPLLRGDAAAEGLTVLALRDPEPVCAALPRLLSCASSTTGRHMSASCRCWASMAAPRHASRCASIEASCRRRCRASGCASRLWCASRRKGRRRSIRGC
jgi:hypothetical protein